MFKYKRILLKLSGEALAAGKGSGYDEATVRDVAQQVLASVKQGVEVGIVIGQCVIQIFGSLSSCF